MLFNSFPFLLFLLTLVAVYYILPYRWRWGALLVASYYFYSTFQVVYLLLLLYATVVAYLAGLFISRRAVIAKMVMTLAVIAELFVLVLYKYFDFFMSSLEPVMQVAYGLTEPFALPRLEFLLPAGLSFYTFSAISYIVDVKRGTIPPERNFARLALYIAFFPKLLAGPIERAKPFLEQIGGRLQFDNVLFAFGLQIFLWGLFKKVVIADRLAMFVDSGFAAPDFQSPITVLIGVYFYAFQIYCDFSGYSDMAIGVAALLGIRLMENFRRPYFATNIAEFWSKRWHISLMMWFRDYLYIPLGGNRVSKPRWYANQMIVFLVSGLWHGANWTFVVWGGLNGAYQAIYLMLGGARSRIARIMPHWLWATLGAVLTFHLVLVSWVFFRADSLATAWAVLRRIGSSLPQIPSLLPTYPWSGDFWLAVGLIVFLLAAEALTEFKSRWAQPEKVPVVVRWSVYYLLIGALLMFGQWNLSQFVYMQF